MASQSECLVLLSVICELVKYTEIYTGTEDIHNRFVIDPE